MKRKIVAVWVSLAMLFGFVVIVDVVMDITPPVKAATITVDDSGGADYLTIQEGIDAANLGNTVFVYNGTYNETVIVDKTINLTGENRDSTIVDAKGFDSVFTITANWVNITGFTVTGGASGGYAGIELNNAHNCSIINNNAFSNYWYGFYAELSSRNIIADNNISNNNFGFRLMYSDRNIITDNIISFNIGEGLEVYYSHRNNITGNNASNNSIGLDLYRSNGNNITYNTANGNGYGIYLYYCNDNNFIGNKASTNAFGLELYYSDGNYIRDNRFSSNRGYGLNIKASHGNNFTNLTITSNNWDGIYLYMANWNNLINNNISSNDRDGIYLYVSSGNNLTSNTIYSNTWDGINLYGSNANNLTRNIIFSNKEYGINLNLSEGNHIYHNNFIVNANQSYDDLNNSNQWDNGYPSGGNYWSDYNGVDLNSTPSQDVPPSDGLGDTPYVIDSDSQDNYPLMELFTNRYFENYTILKQGWNLISIPLVQGNTSLKKILEMIDGYYDAVQWYDSTDPNKPWKHNKVGKLFGNDLSNINHTMGFWIHITNPGDTIFLYNGTQPTFNQSITLHPGWNMVGYPSLINRTRDNALNNIVFDQDVDVIWTFNAATQTWQETGPSDYFELGRGYWIHSKVTKVWDVPL